MLLLAKYVVDLRSLKESERETLYEILDRDSETGLSMTKEFQVYTFLLDEKINPLSIPGLTEAMLRRVP